MQKIRLLREDYEQYFFTIPVNKLLGKKRKQFIAAELEQRHPCFSDDFGFDSILKLTRKGILSDVVVIDKTKLSEYRAKYGLWNPGFFIGDSKRIRFISSLLRKFLGGVVIGLSLFLFSSVIIQLRQNEKNRLKNAKAIQIETDSEVFSSNEHQLCMPAGEKCRKLLDCIQENHGRILTLKWEIQGYKEKLKVSLCDLYPEDLLNCFPENEISSLIYKNGNPFFDFGITQEIGIKGKSQKSASLSEFHNEIRTALNSNHIQIIEENYTPVVLKFSIKENFSLFKEIEQLLKEYDIGVSCVSITESNNQSFFVELHLLEDFLFSDGLPVGLLSTVPQIFMNVKREKTERDNTENKELVAKNKEISGLTKVGEVKYQDGKALVFYVNKDGKLIKRLVNE